jgi:hypothetical protein
MSRYILIEWPESQEFMGRSDCYFCQCNDENSFGTLDQAMFVPENVYDSYINDVECKLDYWTKLEHQYAGMAMQGMIRRAYEAYCDDCANYENMIFEDAQALLKDHAEALADVCDEYAHALVKKMKEERK